MRTVLAVLLLGASLLMGACTRTCGVDCAENCWPRGRIGPTCEALCQDREEPVCSPCTPANYRAYQGPVPGKHTN